MFIRVIELRENNVFIQRGRYGLPPLQLQKSSILWGQRWISVSFLNALFLLIQTHKDGTTTDIYHCPCPTLCCQIGHMSCFRQALDLALNNQLSLCLSLMQFEEKKIRRKLKANPLHSHSFPYFETFLHRKLKC